MVKSIEDILNKNVTRTDPSSITLIEWYKDKMHLTISDFYKNDSAFQFHEKSINRKNSRLHYVDFIKKKINDQAIDGRYFDDLSFKEEKEQKEILKDFNDFFKNKISYIDEKIIDKLLWIINELERNVRNHAYYDEQKKYMSYASNILKHGDISTIILNISDYGIGFEKRRDDNRSYSVLSTQGNSVDSEHYVLEAVKPGISTMTNADKIANRGNINSGYGLYMLNKIASNKQNKLEIISDGKLFVNNFNSKSLRYIKSYSELIGITSITFTFKVHTLEKQFKLLEKEKSNFSTKSNYAS